MENKFQIQGVVSAWDLMDTIGAECNALPSSATSQAQDMQSVTVTAPAFQHPGHVPLDEQGQSVTGASDPAAHDPDADAEWITETNPAADDQPVQFPKDIPVPVPTVYPPRREIPGSYPGVGGLWPSVFFANNKPPDSMTMPPTFTVTLASDPLQNGQMAHLRYDSS